MKLQTLLLSSFLVSALAAPAVVWKKSSEQQFRHTSERVPVADLLGDVLGSGESNSVVFLVGKSSEGSEALTELASSGKLPSTAAKYSDADVFHHVSGIESPSTMVRDASRASAGVRALSVSLGELDRKLTSHEPASLEIAENGVLSKASKESNRRALQLEKANVFIVDIPATEDTVELDRVITATIENNKVDNVVLAGVRSYSEVKHERYMASKQRHDMMEKEGLRILQERRRRLEQEEQGGDAADDAVNNDNGQDLTGVYYVSMTPNIFAGILFLFLFVSITWTGIMCMSSIAGQDVYVSKMPTIGREA